MKDERLYINGKLADIGTDTKVTMNIKSNLFRDVSKIASNSTYTINLPKTTNNQKIFGHADLMQANNSFGYKTYDVRYFRNGVEIIKNGKATVLRVSAVSFEVSILWGVFPSFSELLTTGAMLNQLDTKDRIVFHAIGEPDNYDDVVGKGYFYAAYSTTRKEDVVDYSWKSTHDMIFPILQKGKHEGKWGGGHWNSSGAIEGLHPVVRASWVLDLIREKKNIDFQFPQEEREYINTLVMPLISKKSNELTFDGLFTADMLPKDEKGAVSLTVKETTNVFKGAVGETLTSVEAKANTDILIDIKATWELDITGRKPVGHTSDFYHNEPTGYSHYAFEYGYWLKISIQSGLDVEVLIIGPNEKNFIVTSPDNHRGVVRFQYSGYGKAKVEEHSTITIEWLSDGVIEGAKFTGGEVKINLQNSDNVLNGGYFPITSNLPKIKIIDFVKFLAAITGTFPLQMNNGNMVRFVPLATIWKNKSNAVDWTDRVIAYGRENKPQAIEFSMSDYGQHNLYKWKTDETVKGNYDGDLKILNDTLEVEKTIIEFPFAATDGDNVPMYEEQKRGEGAAGGSFGGGVPKKNENESKVDATSAKDSYKACKDRVLRLSRNEKGKAVARFDINMQEIIDTKYSQLAKSLEHVKIVTEKVRMSDTELAHFDETKPVYLAQYGSYFAVTEIKADETGVAEAILLKLNTI